MKIFKGKKARRGFTLVELCVVMALISIASLMMISFTSAFQIKSTQILARHEFLDEVSNVRDAMQIWISNHDYANSTVKVYPEIISNETDMVSFVNGEFCFKYSGAETRISTERIKSIEYAVYSNNRILKCTFTGIDNYGREFSQTMLFSLSSGTAKFSETSP